MLAAISSSMYQGNVRFNFCAAHLQGVTLLGYVAGVERTSTSTELQVHQSTKLHPPSCGLLYYDNCTNSCLNSHGRQRHTHR